ncbi:hypothetical protein DFH05DRAFT_1400365 [Lentinula detonsa]|uniref:Sodium/calcium exchanger membrane region domain-containing protein n=1 Tax=Lentinula detonsa TaxID=2804962 RepID=A0A9W8NXE4_9AGAR|nr:hypothetical protein DFH05DRAFT_1400365 [Lentinula detonsa]
MSVLVKDFEAHRDYVPFILSRSSSNLLLVIFVFTPLLNVMLLTFIPMSIASHFGNWDVALRFSVSFIATMNLTKFLNEATDSLSNQLDRKHTGLLNVSFGNAVKIVAAIAALLQEYGMLTALYLQILGSILTNILLILGWSFIVAGLKFSMSDFETTAAQALTFTEFVLLTCIILMMPTAHHALSNPNSIQGSALSELADTDSKEQWQDALLKSVSRATAILTLVMYFVYLFFQLKTHRNLFRNKFRFLDKDVDQRHSLAFVTALTTFCSELLVASIEELCEKYYFPKSFISLIILPLANADNTSAMKMAMRGQMGVTVDICIGSAIQSIALMEPLLVIVGWITGHEVPLFFGKFETIVFFSSVLLALTVVKNGKSNYLEGVVLVTLYLIIALACSQL